MTADEANTACFCGCVSYKTILSGRFDRIMQTGYQFTIARCRRCGLARTLPVPDVSQYEHGYSLTTTDGRFSGSPADEWSESIADYIRARAPRGRLLDIGCNVGNLVAAANARGFVAEGIDVDPVATEEARRLGRPVRTGTIEDLDGGYDVVVLNQVLEHILDLRSFLTSLGRVVSEEGLLFVFVPHYGGWIPRLMRDRWMLWVPHQHVWHFRPSTLLATVHEATPLKVMHCTTLGTMEPPSKGSKGRVKVGFARLAERFGQGDQIEAVFVNPAASHPQGRSA